MRPERKTRADKPAGALARMTLGEGSASIWLPVNTSLADLVTPYEPPLADLIARMRPARLLEVGGETNVAGLAAAENGWAERVRILARDVLSARIAQETISARKLAGADVVLGEGPLDTPDDRFDAVIVHQQPSRALTDSLLRQATARLDPGGAILLGGAIRKGVRVATKVLDEICEEVRREVVMPGARVVLGQRVRPGVEATPFARRRNEVDIAGVKLRWVTTPGVFSADALDPATALLLGAIRLPHRGRVLDLGCGAGAIGLWCALRMPECDVTMVDSDVASVRCAEEGIRMNRLANAHAVLSDATEAVKEERFEVVATNPPAHRAGRSDPMLAERFVREAARAVGRKGRLWLVAAPTIPVGRAMEELFTEISVAAEDGRFRVWDAIRRPPRQTEREDRL